MEYLNHLDLKYALLALLVAGQGYYIIKSNFSMPMTKTPNALVKGTKADGEVELNLLKGAGGSVSSSPFSVKLAMYCRLAGIPHKTVEADFAKAPNGKIPYIVHNGNIIGDSQLIIRYLENTFPLDATIKKSMISNEFKLNKAFVPFSKLSAQDQSQSDLIRILCESEMYWGLISIRWLGAIGMGRNEYLWQNTVATYFAVIPSFIRGVITNMLRTKIYHQAYGQGLCRHSADDQIYLIQRDLMALSVQLGKKPYFLGDFPSECDCSAFGALETYCDDSKWPNEVTTFIRTNCKNLMEYQQRIKSTVFFDVDANVTLPPSRI